VWLKIFDELGSAHAFNSWHSWKNIIILCFEEVKMKFVVESIFAWAKLTQIKM